MKLNLKKIQSLDILFKYFSYKENLHSNFNIVIKIDNQLWQGDFINFKDGSIKEFSLINQNELNCEGNFLDHFFKLYKKFRFDHYLELYKKSENENYFKYVLLEEFLKALDKCTLHDFNLKNVLYNAVNLSTNTKLPFIYLTDEEYEIVSLVEVKESNTNS